MWAGCTLRSKLNLSEKREQIHLGAYVATVSGHVQDASPREQAAVHWRLRTWAAEGLVSPCWIWEPGDL